MLRIKIRSVLSFLLDLQIPLIYSFLIVGNLVLNAASSDRYNKRAPFSVQIFRFANYLWDIASKHGLCPYYLKKLNRRNCSCRRGEDSQDDILHYVLTCPLLSHIRSLISHNTPAIKILTNQRLTTEAKLILSELYMHQQNIFEMVY
ncbi:hypothetical protein AVEN_268969-1 [Araneus ventricosus]|uniref:Uncharacterized protein n=1 Tax=Araneus ventricosus TaxID=182803 RepID=A0A4Y2I3A9_ARAVE|nr:hypothetical protein AVEN_268969-1 [Araneus ventricosus]